MVKYVCCQRQQVPLGVSPAEVRLTFYEMFACLSVFWQEDTFLFSEVKIYAQRKGS